tara:strand:+ start:69 stop:215 length:147 start_codon:yes stop_codon:yes gene_type:complete
MYELLSDGQPKYQMIWTNHTKKFFIADKEVDEDTWLKQIQNERNNNND